MRRKYITKGPALSRERFAPGGPAFPIAGVEALGRACDLWAVENVGTPGGMSYRLRMARGNRKNTPRMNVSRRGDATVVSTTIDARAAAFGRGMMPPPTRVHDANKQTSRYKRRESKRADRQAMRGGRYDDL